MSDLKPPRFAVGEVAILQPPHPTARHLWGQETTILAIYPSHGGEDAMGYKGAKWVYETDVPAPPATDLPEDQHIHWLWCEYDLRKKYDGGDDFEVLMNELKKGLVEVR